MKISIAATVFTMLLVSCGGKNPDYKTWTNQSLEDCSRNQDTNSPCYQTRVHREMDGLHNLRKLMPEKATITPGAYSGSFFLFVGSISKRSDEVNTNVTFAWQGSDGAYSITTVPLEHIRVKIEPNVTIPQVYFRWNIWSTRGDYYTSQYFNQMIEEVTIICREEDWPVNITMPLSGK